MLVICSCVPALRSVLQAVPGLRKALGLGSEEGQHERRIASCGLCMRVRGWAKTGSQPTVLTAANPREELGRSAVTVGSRRVRRPRGLSFLSTRSNVDVIEEPEHRMHGEHVILAVQEKHEIGSC
jgi:hypothetical protein